MWSKKEGGEKQHATAGGGGNFRIRDTDGVGNPGAFSTGVIFRHSDFQALTRLLFPNAHLPQLMFIQVLKLSSALRMSPGVSHAAF